MKNQAFQLLIANIPSMICFGIAGYMAISGISNWGWFIFVGLMCAHIIDKDK